MISIITPTFNRSRVIGRTINTVLCQEYQDWELWLIDDGSTDDTEHVVSPWLTDPRINYIRIEHSGKPAVARNVGMRHARGEFIAFIDSDDEWDPSILSVHLRNFEDDPALVISSTNAWQIIDGAICREVWKSDIPLLKDQFQHLIDKNMVITSTCVIKRSIIEVTGCFDEDSEIAAFEDYHLWLRILCRGRWHYDPRPLAKYHISSDRISVKDSAVNIKKKRAVLKSLRNILPGSERDRLIDRKLKEIRQQYSKEALKRRNIRMLWDALIH